LLIKNLKYRIMINTIKVPIYPLFFLRGLSIVNQLLFLVFVIQEVKNLNYWILLIISVVVCLYYRFKYRTEDFPAKHTSFLKIIDTLDNMICAAAFVMLIYKAFQ
jgi:hypothetical protein